jgi:serine/threonine-protein kinase
MMSAVKESRQADRVYQLLYTLSRAYLQREQYAEALDKLKQLLQLDSENPELFLDTAIAALGLNDASAEMLGVYEKALAYNPESEALKLGLASLFVHQKIATAFAIEVCEKAAELAPVNEQEIRLYLKQYYEACGLMDKAVAEEQRAIFSSRDGEVIRRYLEKLWWDGKFAEAHEALRNAPRVNGADMPLTRELAMTYAYELLANGASVDNKETVKIMLTALASLTPADSFGDFRDHLVLRSSLLEAKPRHWPRGGHDDEINFELKPFDWHRELLDLLKKPEDEPADKEFAQSDWDGVLFAQLAAHSDVEIPEKIRQLFGSHLFQLPDSALRLAGTTFVSLARDPVSQIRAMIDFMQSLEDYNAMVLQAERVMLVGTLQIISLLKQPESQAILASLVDATHLLGYAKQTAASEDSSGILLLPSAAEPSATFIANGINLTAAEPVCVFPGRETICAEVIWRNPLLQLKEGQIYELGRFAIYKRLLKHTIYGTYLAKDVQLDRPVVMKVILPQEAVALQQDDERRNRILHFVRAVGRLSHPYLAFLFDAGEQENMFYVAREYVEGKNLSELDFPNEQRDGEVIVLLQKIVRALMYAKSKGVMHLNLKPSNIWLSEAQELKITDFRIPGFAEDVATASVLLPAHWRYTAPEILLGQPGDTRSDIYSIGIIAYELIAGWHPYNTARNINSPQDIFKARIASLSECDRPHHRAWDDFVMKAMHREVEKRFQNLEEVDQELRNIQMELLQKALNSGR